MTSPSRGGDHGDPSGQRGQSNQPGGHRPSRVRPLPRRVAELNYGADLRTRRNTVRTVPRRDWAHLAGRFRRQQVARKSADAEPARKDSRRRPAFGPHGDSRARNDDASLRHRCSRVAAKLRQSNRCLAAPVHRRRDDPCASGLCFSGLVATGSTGDPSVRSLSELGSSTLPLRNYQIPSTEPKDHDGAVLDFLFQMTFPGQTIWGARVGNPLAANWYTTVTPWTFDLHDLRLQRGGVQILNNVINPGKGRSRPCSSPRARRATLPSQYSTCRGA